MKRVTYSNVCATLALAVALGAGGPALADSISEPDAYAVSNRVDVLQEEVDLLTAELAATDDRLDRVAYVAIVSDLVTDCLAYSERHYVKERIDGKGKKYRLPLVVWRGDLRACQPARQPTRRIAR